MLENQRKTIVFASYGPPGTPKMRPRWAQVGRRWPQDGPRWPKMAPRSPKMAPRCAQVALRCPSCPEDGSQHRADTAIFPFFAHVPSENTVLASSQRPQHKSATRGTREKTSYRHRVNIVIFPFFEDIPSEITILAPSGRPNINLS